MIKLRAVIESYLPLFYQICRFGIVGLTAATIHFSVVVLLVQAVSIPPLVANILGFMISFQVSYWGHRLWTFSDADVLHSEAFPKLLTLQLVNLGLNESLFYIFLSLGLPYTIALIIVLTILPFFTFIFSKMWVFR